MAYNEDNNNKIQIVRYFLDNVEINDDVYSLFSKNSKLIDMLDGTSFISKTPVIYFENILEHRLLFCCCLKPIIHKPYINNQNDIELIITYLFFKRIKIVFNFVYENNKYFIETITVSNYNIFK